MLRKRSKFGNRLTKTAKTALNTAKQRIRRDKFGDWLRENPGGSFKEFYVESVADALEGKTKHPSLGPRPTSSDRSRRNTFEKLVAQGIHPDDTVVDYGCGTLRIGGLFIELLEPGRYIGLDIDDRILAAALNRLSPQIISSKQPVLEVISPDSLRRTAAKRPRWVFSKGVLHHVPPEDLQEYFQNLSCLIPAGATGLIRARLSSKTRKISPLTWMHEPNSLLAAAASCDMQLSEAETLPKWLMLRRRDSV